MRCSPTRRPWRLSRLNRSTGIPCRRGTAQAKSIDATVGREQVLVRCSVAGRGLIPLAHPKVHWSKHLKMNLVSRFFASLKLFLIGISLATIVGLAGCSLMPGQEQKAEDADAAAARAQASAERAEAASNRALEASAAAMKAADHAAAAVKEATKEMDRVSEHLEKMEKDQEAEDSDDDDTEAPTPRSHAASSEHRASSETRSEIMVTPAAAPSPAP